MRGRTPHMLALVALAIALVCVLLGPVGVDAASLRHRARAASKAKGEDSDVDYQIMIQVSPDNELAGTVKPLKILLKGASSSMTEPTDFLPGCSAGETLETTVTGINVGAVQQMTVSQVEGGDSALLEIVSLDSNPAVEENGDAKYVNFANTKESMVELGADLTLAPEEGYVVTIRTSNFVHAGTSNPVSVKFISEDGASSEMLLSASGFAKAESRVVVLQDTAPQLTSVVAIVLAVDYKDDDVWMPDEIRLNTPTQRAVFHNSDSMFIGYKPYKLYSDKTKFQQARDAYKKGGPGGGDGTIDLAKLLDAIRSAGR